MQSTLALTLTFVSDRQVLSENLKFLNLKIISNILYLPLPQSELKHMTENTNFHPPFIVACAILLVFSLLIKLMPFEAYHPSGHAVALVNWVLEGLSGTCNSSL